MRMLEPTLSHSPLTSHATTQSQAEVDLRRCTDLLKDFVETRQQRLFNELAELAQPFLWRRASFELARLERITDESEVVQDTLFNIFRYGHTFQPSVPHAFATWSARIVRNVVLRHMRTQSCRPTLSLEDCGGAAAFVSPQRADPMLRLEECEERQLLRRNFSLWLRVYVAAYAQLTELQRRILHAVEVEGLRYRELAERMGMRSGAVKMVVFRGRRRILQLMERAAAC